MLDITLPDGSVKQVADNCSAAELAVLIGPGLAKAAVAVKVDGELKDLDFKFTKASSASIVTLKNPEGLEILRHSTAHIMAAAVKQLYPKAQVTIGPAIESGFYYDFDMEERLSEEDLGAIEAKMRDLVKRADVFGRSEMDAAAAIALFKDRGEPYKAEIIKDLGQARVSLYQVGEFLDLCRGPHLPSSDKVPSFKLLAVAGAYWRGDEKNRMLTRIYGTAFATPKELEEHLKRLEEAKKRDHRRLGKDLDLFSFQEEAGPGLVYWHPKGAMVRKLIEDFWRDEHIKAGYGFVVSPHIGRAHLWETSGHLENYKEGMYSPMDIDGQDYYIKPMNCPFHILMFKNSTRSYRDLPLRMAELGTVYRYERSGTLHGLMRVRGFTQDDSHIFLAEDMLGDEIKSVVLFIRHMLQSFGFTEFEVFVSTRPKDSMGEPALWEKATQALKDALDSAQWAYAIDEGGGAFYGPKIDFRIKDSIGRTWQCSTLQLDFNLPQRFKMQYVAPDGTRQQPVMLHRALLGSLERFFGILIEHYAGAFPIWLAPVQVRVLTITNAQDAYARNLIHELEERGLRVDSDLSGEKINAKVRDAQMAKIPCTLVVGAKEAESGQVALRRFGSPENTVIAKEQFILQTLEEIRLKK
jgi:threonyl-tRNA synthetase